MPQLTDLFAPALCGFVPVSDFTSSILGHLAFNAMPANSGVNLWSLASGIAVLLLLRRRRRD
jgi:hypothetical protein